jgi:hypothetical protein
MEKVIGEKDEYENEPYQLRKYLQPLILGGNSQNDKWSCDGGDN